MTTPAHVTLDAALAATVAAALERVGEYGEVKIVVSAGQVQQVTETRHTRLQQK